MERYRLSCDDLGRRVGLPALAAALILGAVTASPRPVH
jgi:hypothetical protein